MIIINSILISFLDIWKKKSKIIFLLTIFFLWIIMGFTYGDADYSLYVSRYYNSAVWVGKTEILYSALITIARNMGLEFVHFKAIIAVINLVLVGSTILKFSKYPNLVLLLYYIFPFPLNVVQMRSAMAESIFVFCCRFLLDESGKKIKLGRFFSIDRADLFYCIGIALATLIHATAIIWLILLIAKKASLKKTVYFTLITNLVVLFIKPTIIISILYKLVPQAATRMASYFSLEYQHSDWRHYSQIVLVIFVAAVILYMGKVINNRSSLVVDDRFDIMIRSNIIILIILSLMIKYTQEVYRLQEGLFVINYIFLTNSVGQWSYNGKIKGSSIVIIGGSCILAFSAAAFLIYHYIFNTVMYPILHNNYFFDYIF